MLQIILVQDFCPLKIKITECPSGCRLNSQNNNFARASHFWYISLRFSHYCDVIAFAFYGEHKQATTKCYFSF